MLNSQRVSDIGFTGLPRPRTLTRPRKRYGHDSPPANLAGGFAPNINHELLLGAHWAHQGYRKLKITGKPHVLHFFLRP
jgi:hypothetical protein